MKKSLVIKLNIKSYDLFIDNYFYYILVLQYN